MRAAHRETAQRQPGWALRFGRTQDCDCAPWQAPARTPAPVCVAPASSRRRSIWDLGPSLHCSIIGTCLTTDAMRRLIRKLHPAEAGANDHRLHGLAVGLCTQQGVASRLINKALDEQHRIAIRRFDTARDTTALRRLWTEAQAAGDIPGAYWAVLTHPVADQTLMTDVFGDVHMLSHLVGASNRADIRRLAEQEREIAALRATVARQQQRLRDDILERDARIRSLQAMLVATAQQQAAMPASTETDRLIAALQARVAQVDGRAEALAGRVAERDQALSDERRRHAALEQEVESLRREIGHAEALLAVPPEDDRAECTAFGTVLYVGGRSGQSALLRRTASAAGAELLHHDAEQGSSLLAGLVGRARLIVFPVDCVSHDAALTVKRLCRQHDRPFRPLRTTGAASLLSALREFGATAAVASG